MKKRSIFLLMLSFAPLLSFGQAKGNYDYNQEVSIYTGGKINNTFPRARLENTNSLTFEVTALINAPADAYLAIFNLTQVGATAQETEEYVTDRYNKFVAAAKAIGVEEKDIFIDMVSFVPVFETVVERKLFSKRYNEIPKGFELQKNIHVVYKDGRTLDKLVGIAAQQEIFDLIKVDYYVEKTNGIYNTLREACITELLEKTADYEKIGIQLDDVKRIMGEAKSVAFPPNRYGQYQAYNSSSVDAIKGKGKEVKKAPKRTTRYYEKIAYDGFDIVLNPVMLEPSVQFTFSLKVQFLLNQPIKPLEPIVKTETKVQNQVFWLNEAGEIRSFNFGETKGK